jgi:hypothetical protein
MPRRSPWLQGCRLTLSAIALGQFIASPVLAQGIAIPEIPLGFGLPAGFQFPGAFKIPVGFPGGYGNPAGTETPAAMATARAATRPARRSSM